ncbi:hypothetical protein EW145_g3243 [Phellinidium pouzarii]|uniref:Uncharacterized protein n=1 Tax=Phellinidium pouzarii TaxID=167371 RepID=A0A4V3XCY1_9AGAM|nr:hypothetical protein EW145_g3243 [Phellinidium pouzarii]
MSRWQHVPLACNAMIPDEFTAERAWCRDLQALKAFVWIEWVILFVTTFLTARFVVREHARGNTHVWSTSLAAYEPRYYNSASAFPFESRNGKGAGAGARADYAFDGTGNEGMHRRTSSFFSGFGSRRNGNITDTGATVAPSETGANPSAHASFVDFGREWRPRSWAL